MQKLEGWLWLLIALLWLLPLVGVSIGSASAWIQVIALAIIGYSGVKGK